MAPLPRIIGQQSSVECEYCGTSIQIEPPMQRGTNSVQTGTTAIGDIRPLTPPQISRVDQQFQQNNQYSQYPTRKYSKSKTTAVILSVFFSFFSWLYTYKRNAWKFWLSLVLYIVLSVVSAAVVLGSGFSIFLVLGIWLWALIDNSKRTTEWYQQY